MGNIVQRITPTSEESTGASSKVIAQSQAQSPHNIYKLVQPPTTKQEGGRGILVEEAAQCFQTKNYDSLREKIRQEFQDYLYDGGIGKNIPIKTIVENRNAERKQRAKKSKEETTIKSMLYKKPSFSALFVYNGTEQETRKCCWRIDTRGALGETALHICLLNNTRIHTILAKEIINVFPNLLHDIYLGDEYYGENLLHMAIANEDKDFLMFLLRKGKEVGLNIQERCFGNFFCPFDQKATRQDVDNSEVVAVSTNTNYKGLVYWGEYPLSFAACSNQEEMFALLLKEGADLMAADTNGNNVLHLMVIHDDQKMFDLSYEQAGSQRNNLLEARNKQGLTPLTLSAKLANKKMLDHILELKREIAWIFGDVTCAHYPLSDIDTINPDDGSINNQSALSIILNADSTEHLSMLDGLLYQLLHEKWKQYAKIRFYERAFFFLIFMAIFVAAIYLQPAQPKMLNAANETVYLENCYLLSASSAQQTARFVLEIITIIGACIYLLLAGLDLYYEGIITFWYGIVNAPMKGSFLFSCSLILAVIPCRFACSVVAENVILTLAIFTCIPYLFFFCRGFKLVGPFIVAIYKMIIGDLLRFLIIYLIFLLGFSQAMFVLFRGVNHPLFSYPFLSILGMFIITLGEFGDLYDDFNQLRNPNAAKLLFIVYMIVVFVLLINVLIAMMGNTFYRIAETRWEWQRQWAKIVLVMEQSVSPDHRKAKQRRYSQPISDQPGRWFVVRNVREKKN